MNYADFVPEHVFPPGAVPEVTYVDRGNYEHELDSALKVQGMFVSIAGPTKTGKTVLVKQVVGSRAVIVSGSVISAEEFWDSIRGELEFDGTPAELVSRMMANDRVLVLDDSHYLPRNVQQELARQLKEPASRGLGVVVITTQTHGDDFVRANPDLRGRFIAIDLGYWSSSDLAEIPNKGFPFLNVRIASASRDALVAESVGAPQIMQALCLETCRQFGIQDFEDPQREITIQAPDLIAISEHVAVGANFQTTYEVLRNGSSGTRRRTPHELIAGGDADVYELILEAMAVDPPALQFPIAELRTRVDSLVVTGRGPTATSLLQAIRQMHRLARDHQAGGRVLEWNDLTQTLVITDPYFAFYLRHRPAGINESAHQRASLSLPSATQMEPWIQTVAALTAKLVRRLKSDSRPPTS